MSLPNMSQAFKGLTQTFTIQIKTSTSVIDGRVQDVYQTFSSKGVIQPSKPIISDSSNIGIKQIERLTIHTFTLIPTKIGDIIMYKDKRYRINDYSNYSAYGFYRYEIDEEVI